MDLKMSYCTDPGRVREHNEDYLGVDKSLGLAIIADGMGGYQAGEVASKLAVQTILNQLGGLPKTQFHQRRYVNRHCNEATVLLEQAVLKANQVIYELAEQQMQYRGMGTTVVAVWLQPHIVSVAHVGDSRLYRLRGNTFCQMTKDHSVRQELIDCGFYTSEQARHSAHKNLVTRALGVGDKVNVEIQEYQRLAQDIYLLCSDGLSDMVSDFDLHAIVNGASTFEEAAQCLVNAANKHGGKDNISVILLPPQASQKSPKTWWQRWFAPFW